MPLIIVTLFFCGAFVLMMKLSSRAGLLFCVGLIGTVNFSFFEGELASRIAIPDILFLVFFFVTFCREALSEKKVMIFPVSPNIFQGFLVLGILVSYLLSEVPNRAMFLGGGEWAIVLFSVLIFNLLCSAIRNKTDYRLFCEAWLLSSGIVILVSFLDAVDLYSRSALMAGALTPRSGFFGIWDMEAGKMANHSFFSPLAGRIMGSFRSNGQLATYSLTSFFVFMAYAYLPQAAGWKKKTAVYAAWALVLTGVLSMTLRTLPSLLIGALFVLIYSFFTSKQIFRHSLIGLFLIAVILISMVWVNPEVVGYWERYLGFYRANEVVGNSPFRAMFLGPVLAAFKENPLFGIGFGRFIESSYHGLPRGFEIHSTPLQFLAETGIFGSFCYLSFMLYFAYLSVRNFLLSRKTEWNHFFSILLIATLCLPLSYIYSRHLKERTFWLVLGLIYLGNEILKRMRQKNAVTAS